MSLTSEILSGWGKQSRAMGVPKISCQENVHKIMKSFDARRETPSLFLDRFCERFGCEAAVAVGESFLFSAAVRDGFGEDFNALN